MGALALKIEAIAPPGQEGWLRRSRRQGGGSRSKNGYRMEIDSV